MRPEFLAITSGWTLVNDFDAMTERIERAADWSKNNGPMLPDEHATIQFMIEYQIILYTKENILP